jgi:hypothetical protein
MVTIAPIETKKKIAGYIGLTLYTAFEQYTTLSGAVVFPKVLGLSHRTVYIFRDKS